MSAKEYHSTLSTQMMLYIFIFNLSYGLFVINIKVFGFDKVW